MSRLKCVEKRSDIQLEAHSKPNCLDLGVELGYFLPMGSTTILRSAFQVFGGRSLLGSWSGRAVAERTVGNLFMEFMKLEMLVDWVFPG